MTAGSGTFWRCLLFALAITLCDVAALYAQYGTIAPCGVLRERIRQNARGTNGRFDGSDVLAMANSALEAVITLRYGPLTPGRCTRILFDQAVT